MITPTFVFFLLASAGAANAEATVGGQIIVPTLAAPAASDPAPVDPLASKVASAAATEAAPPTGPVLRVLERRRLGLTVRNVVKKLQEMKAEGKLAAYASEDESGRQSINVSALSVAVAQRIAADRPEQWQAVDWDQVIEFIERLLAVLAEWLPILIDLFTSTVQTAPALVGASPPPIFTMAA